MPLSDLSASALSAGLKARTFSASEVMAETLARIEAVNPALNALVSLRPAEALLAEAEAADREAPRGWLHGVPVAIKDLIAVRGIVCSSGSPLYATFVPDADDGLAARLRNAGAIIIGKTNVPEFGLGSHTFNPVFGATANPYDPALSAGGSSGGAAAALAARLVPVADGSDAMGSLRNPAAFCNVYGFRPSFGLVPGEPEGDTFLHQLATNGPMARTVEDIARLLFTLAEPDARLPHGRAREDYATGLDTNIAGRRIGWLGDWGGALAMEPGIVPLCEAALEVFAAQGAEVEALKPPFALSEIWQAWTTLRSWSNAMGLAEQYRDPAQRAHLKPEAVWEIERGLALSAEDVHRASVIRSRWFVRAAELFATYDALALPSAQVWPFPKGWRYPERIGTVAMDSYHRWMEVVVPVSLLGLPALALPAGFGPAGLPTGLQVFGPRGGDRRILQLGQAYHRATDWPGRVPPGAGLPTSQG
ncbi:MAG: amidase [Paracoccaceae bacterium]